MPAFAVAGTTVPVQSVDVEYVDIQSRVRRFSGKMSSTTRGSDIQARSWSVTTSPLTASEASALEADLIASGYVNISGDLIGGTVSVEAQGIGKVEGEVADQVRVSFEAVEVL